MNLVASTTQDLPSVLSFSNISVTFGGVRALQDVAFEVLPGEVQCIAGENGSGKST
ncbi:MAG: sugar ABC transporter ATP-binding protein, partial [Mesorhizobium sp.]